MIDRVLQKSILNFLADIYPNVAKVGDIPGQENPGFIANMYYLHEHRLITGTFRPPTWGSPAVIATAKATAEGMDFLQDDGGVSSILKTITVKLDVDSIRRLLEKEIDLAEIEPEKKASLIEKVKGFSGDTLKEFLVQVSVEALKKPDLLPWLYAVIDKITK